MEIYFFRRQLTSLNSYFLIMWLPDAGLIVISKFHWHQFSFLLDPNRELEISELLSITFTTWLVLTVSCLEDWKASLANQRIWWPVQFLSSLAQEVTEKPREPTSLHVHEVILVPKFPGFINFFPVESTVSHPRLQYQPPLSIIQTFFSQKRNSIFSLIKIFPLYTVVANRQPTSFRCDSLNFLLSSVQIHVM